MSKKTIHLLTIIVVSLIGWGEAKANNIFEHAFLAVRAIDYLDPQQDAELISILNGAKHYLAEGAETVDAAKEPAHWFPFQKSYLEHVKSLPINYFSCRSAHHYWRYSTSHCKQLVHFLGMLSHGISDAVFDGMFVVKVGEEDLGLSWLKSQNPFGEAQNITDGLLHFVSVIEQAPYHAYPLYYDIALDFCRKTKMAEHSGDHNCPQAAYDDFVKTHDLMSLTHGLVTPQLLSLLESAVAFDQSNFGQSLKKFFNISSFDLKNVISKALSSTGYSYMPGFELKATYPWMTNNYVHAAGGQKHIAAAIANQYRFFYAELKGQTQTPHLLHYPKNNGTVDYRGPVRVHLAFDRPIKGNTMKIYLKDSSGTRINGELRGPYSHDLSNETIAELIFRVKEGGQYISLQPGKTYEAIIEAGLQDYKGNVLLNRDVSWRFTAGEADEPFASVSIPLNSMSAPNSGNIALGKPATQSSNYWGATYGFAPNVVDGQIPDGANWYQMAHTGNDPQAWWQVDLQGNHLIHEITLYNRTDCCGSRLSNFKVLLTGPSGHLFSVYEQPGGIGSSITIPVNPPKTGKAVKIQLNGQNYLHMKEVVVKGVLEEPSIWGVNGNDQIWKRRINSNWEQVAGGLKHVSIGDDGSIWGVNSGDYIYRWNGSSWDTIPGRLKQVSVGSASHVWGVNSGDYIYRWNGSNWDNIPGRLKHVSVGSDGEVWGVNAGDNIYRWTGSTWTQMPGGLKQIAVGSASHVWGVNSGDYIYRWTGSGWENIAGRLKYVSAGADGEVWGVNSNDNIYRRTGSTWTQIAGGLKQIESGLSQ